jgi:hypothetical protein
MPQLKAYQSLALLLFLFSQPVMALEKWILLPFEKENMDASCGIAFQAFMDQLISSITAELNIQITSDLQPLPCAKLDCALIRSQSVSSKFAIYGKVSCESTALQIDLKLLVPKINPKTGELEGNDELYHTSKQNKEGDWKKLAILDYQKLINGKQTKQSQSLSRHEIFGAFGLSTVRELTSPHLLPISFQLGYFYRLSNRWDLGGSAQLKQTIAMDQITSQSLLQGMLAIHFRYYWRRTGVSPFTGIGIGLSMGTLTEIKTNRSGLNARNEASDIVDWKLTNQYQSDIDLKALAIPIEAGIKWSGAVLKPFLSTQLIVSPPIKTVTLFLGVIW